MADFWRAYDLLNQDSYWAPLDKKKLIYAGINGMLAGGTGDSHTIFLSPAENALENSQLDGSFDGIGAYVTASQKGLALPPGMAVAVVSPDLLERARSADERATGLYGRLERWTSPDPSACYSGLIPLSFRAAGTVRFSKRRHRLCTKLEFRARMPHVFSDGTCKRSWANERSFLRARHKS